MRVISAEFGEHVVDAAAHCLANPLEVNAVSVVVETGFAVARVGELCRVSLGVVLEEIGLGDGVIWIIWIVNHAGDGSGLPQLDVGAENRILLILIKEEDSALQRGFYALDETGRLPTRGGDWISMKPVVNSGFW